MRLLVTGASGFVGRHVSRSARAEGLPVTGAFHTKPALVDGVDWRALDVTDPEAVAGCIAEVAPDAVVHAATVPTNSRLAPDATWSTIAVGAVNVAKACARQGVRLVHLSSDAVFTGRPEPFREADTPSPVYPYASAKAAAELAVSAVAPGAVIVRVSVVCGEPGGEIAPRERFMLDLAAGTAEGVAFTDDVRCPLAVTDLAAAIVELAGFDYAGVLHIGGPDALSYYELARLVVRWYGADPDALPAATTAEAGVVRPGNVVLDSSLATSILRTRVRSARELFAVPAR